MVKRPLVTLSDEDVVEIAGRYLKDKHLGGAMLEALAQGVRHEQDWWYVPVRPSLEPPRQYEYYEALAELSRKTQSILRCCSCRPRRRTNQA